MKHIKYPNWWSQEISDAIRLRNSTDRASNPELFKVRRNHVTRIIRECKKDYYTALLERGRTAIREFWKHFREVLPSKRLNSILIMLASAPQVTLLMLSILTLHSLLKNSFLLMPPILILPISVILLTLFYLKIPLLLTFPVFQLIMSLIVCVA